jgi:hypothetical protein
MERRVAREPFPAPSALARRNRIVTLAWSNRLGGQQTGE